MLRGFGRMAFVVLLLVVLATATGCIGAGGGSPGGDSDTGDDISDADPTAVIHEFHERYKAKDAEGAAALFTYPATISSSFDDTETFADQDELREYYEEEVLKWIGEVYDSQVTILDSVVSGDTVTIEFEIFQDAENLDLEKRVQVRIKDQAQLK